MPRSLEEQKRGTCVHFNGTMNKRCEVGVEYDAVSVAGLGIPCLRGLTFRGEALECSLRRWPTEEEVQEAVAEIRKQSKQTLQALEAVAQDAKSRGLKKGNGGRGEVVCPLCGGTIHYSVAAYNGHRHARCTTDGCVCFME